MSKTNPSFAALHRHGFVRLATSTPRVRPADVGHNTDSVIEAAQRAHAAQADLVVFPELCISSYAIDDLHMQGALLAAVEQAVARVIEASRKLSPVLLIGAPLRRGDRLYNCALAISRGRLLGVVPKSYLPNYREFYEKRWFAHGRDTGGEIALAGQVAPFGDDLIFAASDLPGLIFHIEICEDLWTAAPPSSDAALAGALILTNLSASNIVIGKSSDRHLLCQSQSMRTISAYAYSAAGPGESTTDLSWDGQGIICELGEVHAESSRFMTEPELVLADIDTGRLTLERMRTGSFHDAARHREPAFRRVEFEHRPHMRDAGLMRPVRRFPYVPNRASHLDLDCYEAFNIQVEGLRRRFQATSGDTMVIGISGGLDSTHALIVAAKACDRMGISRERILGFTMPGFATSEGTKSNAWKLMRAMGITAEEIDIRPAARQMLTDMGHPFAEGEPVYDIAFENVQAGLRTDYLFRLANQRRGFVVGTGDLSELALGWCTYGVGDQMSHYAVNAGVPKTLIQYLIRWSVTSGQFDPETDAVLTAILDTEISPELVPTGEDEEIQSTEATIGPYALNDFFLYHIMRYGLPPSKVAFLAWHAWHDREAGRWPEGFPEEGRPEYDLPVIRHWLEKFLHRFFATSQFKRSALPNGPKVSAGGALSPRGDWRAPSDSTAAPWLAELRDNVPETWPGRG
jgi:NAD+ synthase (glutamine-hydrolysing)